MENDWDVMLWKESELAKQEREFDLTPDMSKQEREFVAAEIVEQAKRKARRHRAEEATRKRLQIAKEEGDDLGNLIIALRG